MNFQILPMQPLPHPKKHPRALDVGQATRPLWGPQLGCFSGLVSPWAPNQGCSLQSPPQGPLAPASHRAALPCSPCSALGPPQPQGPRHPPPPSGTPRTPPAPPPPIRAGPPVLDQKVHDVQRGPVHGPDGQVQGGFVRLLQGKQRRPCSLPAHPGTPCPDLPAASLPTGACMLQIAPVSASTGGP